VRRQDVEPGAALGAQGGPVVPNECLVGNGEHGAIEPGEHDAARLLDGDLNPERLVQAENGARLGGAGSIVVARDDDDGRVGQPHPQALELTEAE